MAVEFELEAVFKKTTTKKIWNLSRPKQHLVSSEQKQMLPCDWSNLSKAGATVLLTHQTDGWTQFENQVLCSELVLNLHKSRVKTPPPPIWKSSYVAKQASFIKTADMKQIHPEILFWLWKLNCIHCWPDCFLRIQLWEEPKTHFQDFWLNPND